MSDKFNNKQFFVKKLIYRSKYTGMKETDMLLGTFADKYLSKFTLNQLYEYEALLDSGDPRILSLSMNKEISKSEKEKKLINLIKKYNN